jgi:serine/threonine protein kinase
VLEEAGPGGSGRLYRARDTRAGREVGITLLPGRQRSQPEQLRLLQRDTFAAADAGALFTIFEVGASEHGAYVVFERLEGETLDRRLARSRLPAGEALHYVLQLARSLAAAHDRGLVHPGLGAERVFLARDGRLEVLERGHPLAGAPVVPLFPGPPDTGADVLAFGRIATRMLPPRIPAPVSDVLARCLDEDPQRRFVSAREMAVALESAHAAAQASAPALRRWSGRALLAASGTLAVLSALLAALLS